MAKSRLVGRTVADAGLRHLDDVYLVEVRRGDTPLHRARLSKSSPTATGSPSPGTFSASWTCNACMAWSPRAAALLRGRQPRAPALRGLVAVGGNDAERYRVPGPLLRGDRRHPSRGRAGPRQARLGAAACGRPIAGTRRLPAAVAGPAGFRSGGQAGGARSRTPEQGASGLGGPCGSSFRSADRRGRRGRPADLPDLLPATWRSRRTSLRPGLPSQDQRRTVPPTRRGATCAREDQATWSEASWPSYWPWDARVAATEPRSVSLPTPPVGSRPLRGWPRHPLRSLPTRQGAAARSAGRR